MGLGLGAGTLWATDTRRIHGQPCVTVSCDFRVNSLHEFSNVKLTSWAACLVIWLLGACSKDASRLCFANSCHSQGMAAGFCAIGASLEVCAPSCRDEVTATQPQPRGFDSSPSSCPELWGLGLSYSAFVQQLMNGNWPHGSGHCLCCRQYHDVTRAEEGLYLCEASLSLCSLFYPGITD